MLKATFCNGSMIQFSSASSFLPGENVSITCSVPHLGVGWASPQFSQSVILSHMVANTTTKLDGAITFELNEVMTSPSPCATATATIANIQESMQGLSLTCSDAFTFLSTVVIDVIGELYVMP